MGPPADGKTIHMNLMRGWRQELDENHIWTFGEYDAATGRLVTERESPNPAGAITLAGSEGVVVRLDKSACSIAGRSNIAATMVNLASKAVKLNAILDSNSGAIKDARGVSLAAGGRQSVRFKGAIADFSTTAVTLRVVDASSGAEYFAQGWPVRRRARAGNLCPQVPLAQTRSCWKTISSSFRVPALRHPGRVDRREQGQPARRWLHKQLTYSTYTPRDEVSTKDWAIGKYDVLYRFTANGKEIGAAKAEYEHAALPAWWDTTSATRTTSSTGSRIRGRPWRPTAGRSIVGPAISFRRRPVPATNRNAREESLAQADDRHGGCGRRRRAEKRHGQVHRADWTKKTKVRVEGAARSATSRSPCEMRCGPNTTASSGAS